MSNERPHLRIIGDKTVASKWIGFAYKYFREIARIGRHAANVLCDPTNNVWVRVLRSNDPLGFNSVIIYANPKLPMFIGVPWDMWHMGGWGYPYGTDRKKDAPTDPDIVKNVDYGTERSHTFKEAFVKFQGNIKVNPVGKRYPEISETEIYYGDIDWAPSEFLRLSWDGVPSRHPIEVYSYDRLFTGKWCLETTSPALIGCFLTTGSECSGDSTTWNKTGALYRVRTVDTQIEGFSSEVWADIYSLSSYDLVSAFSGKVYSQGKVIHDFGSSYAVKGVCYHTGEYTQDLTRNGVKFSQTFLVAILAPHPASHGHYREYLCAINVDDLGSSGTTKCYIKDLDVYYSNYAASMRTEYDQLAEMGELNTSDRNISSWHFNASGTQGVAIRDYLKEDITATDSYELNRYIIKLDISDLTEHFISRVDVSNAKYTKSGPYYNVVRDVSTFEFEGSTTIAVDFDGDTYVQAEVDTTYIKDINTVEEDFHSRYLLKETLKFYRWEDTKYGIQKIQVGESYVINEYDKYDEFYTEPVTNYCFRHFHSNVDVRNRINYLDMRYGIASITARLETPSYQLWRQEGENIIFQSAYPYSVGFMEFEVFFANYKRIVLGELKIPQSKDLLTGAVLTPYTHYTYDSEVGYHLRFESHEELDIYEGLCPSALIGYANVGYDLFHYPWQLYDTLYPFVFKQNAFMSCSAGCFRHKNLLYIAVSSQPHRPIYHKVYSHVLVYDLANDTVVVFKSIEELFDIGDKFDGPYGYSTDYSLDYTNRAAFSRIGVL